MPLGERDCQASYKVLVLGETSVGKTALINNLVGREFRDSMVPTVDVRPSDPASVYHGVLTGAMYKNCTCEDMQECVDFVKKIVEVDGALVQLVIWDTAGQERFRSITRHQYRGVQGIALVYDVTNAESFNHLNYWIASIQHEVENSHRGEGQYEPIPIILCGNKSDMSDARQVKESKGYRLAEKEMAFEFFETSAKTGSNVFHAFKRLAYHITDIQNPKLMKSYHPYMIRSCSETDSKDEFDKIKSKQKQKRKSQKKEIKQGKQEITCIKLKHSLFCGCFKTKECS